MKITVLEKVLDKNKQLADEVKQRLDENKIIMVNLIGSPGSGKTSLLERSIEKLSANFKLAVIEGDLATDKDARRLEYFNIPIVMINTGRGCHLDSHSISKALDKMDLEAIDVILVENVGNLVCPSHFDIGEHAKIAVLSTTEGDDKVSKYPLIFREAMGVILNKTDLIPYTNFDLDTFKHDLKNLNNEVPLFEVSCTKGEGIIEWTDWFTNWLDETF